MPNGPLSIQTITGAEIAAHDWSTHPLGPIEGWPVSLRSLLSMMLSCPTPMFLAWGPELRCFYNDAYRPLLGVRIGGSLGERFDTVWANIWNELIPLVDKTMAGGNVVATDMKLDLARTGEPEDSWWSFTYSTVLSAGLWRAEADRGQLENAIVNLAVNARDAMPDGGKLTIETANAHVGDDYAREADMAAGQYVMIAVTDTGTGMAPDVLAKAFEPFFTTKPVGRGTGLGLSQVFGFVRQSRGHVRIYSEPGVGTTVRLYLPRFYGEEPTPTPRATVEPVRRGSPDETVLVVEDESRVRSFSVEVLRDLGYAVLHASNGPEALALLERGVRVTLLFTDVVMPGMTGRELADRALAMRPDLRVLYTTGYTRNAVVHNGVLDPGTRLLPKPFGVDELARKVREALDA